MVPINRHTQYKLHVWKAMEAWETLACCIVRHKNSCMRIFSNYRHVLRGQLTLRDNCETALRTVWLYRCDQNYTIYEIPTDFLRVELKTSKNKIFLFLI